MDKLEVPVRLFIEVHTPDGRRAMLDVAQIESIFELRPKGHFDSNSVWQVGTDFAEINMRSGDKGRVRNSYSEVIEKINAAYRQAYAEDE